MTQTYRGWSIHPDYIGWSATSPDYEGWTENGKWASNGQSAWGRTIVECQAGVDEWFAGHADAYGREGESAACHPCNGTGTEYGETCVTCGGYGWINE